MIKNLALILTSLFLLLAFGEWLFPKFIGKLPLRLYGSIDKDLRILAQSSKKSLLPNDYIAIVGDSYAVGAGDWLNDEIRKTSFLESPDYSPAHLIHKKTGIDVVSFGQAGAGSFDGIWAEPVNQFLHINSTKDYRLSPPKYFLIFFYEGNDIYDNVQWADEKIKGTELTQTRIGLNEFQDLLNSEFQNILNGNFEKSFWKNMLFTRSILQGTLNIVKEWRSSNKNQKEYFSYPVIPINLALINTKKVPLPMHLQAPPLFEHNMFDKKRKLTHKASKMGVYIFEQALVVLAAFFPQSKIKIVFIPSPISSYEMVSQNVSFRGYMSFPSFVNATVIKNRHRETCEAIQAVALHRNFSFINTTNSLREAASREFIHGPIDWDHFNKSGYEVLSEDLSELFLHSGGGTRIDGCGYKGAPHHQ